MNKNKFLAFTTILFAFLWLTTSGVFVWLFVVGKVAPSDDNRIAVLLTKDERNLVLTEMRGLLEALHKIHFALIENDREKAALAARSVGMEMVSGVADREPGILRKLPLPMKRLGIGTHALFDEIAGTLEDPKTDQKEIFRALSTATGRCVNCHATYRILEDSPNP